MTFRNRGEPTGLLEDCRTTHVVGVYATRKDLAALKRLLEEAR